MPRLVGSMAPRMSGPGREGLLSRASEQVAGGPVVTPAQWEVVSARGLGFSGFATQALGPKPPSGPLVGAPSGHGQLFVGGQGTAGQEELRADGAAAAGLGHLGPNPAGGVATREAALVQGEQLVKHLCDEHQPLVQLCHLWG